jgi:hypothetical protein
MTISKPFVFVLGTGRCGSSLVQELIARHPDVGFVSNVDDRMQVLDVKGRWNNPVYRMIPPRFTRKGRIRFAPSEGYRALGRRVSPIVCEPPRDLLASDASPWLATRLRSFFESRYEAQQRQVFVHKFTGWSRARFLNEVFPKARFVHVYRDGRAVANSLVQMPWWSGHKGPDRWRWGDLTPEDRLAWDESGRSWPVLAAIEWRILIDSLLESQRQLPPGQWLPIKYEDLIRDPDHWLARILDFAGLEDNRTFWSAVRRQTLTAGRIDAYRRDLRAEDVTAMEQVLRNRLEALGYPVGP